MSIFEKTGLASVFIACIFFIGYYAEQSNFAGIILPYLLAFACYFVAYRKSFTPKAVLQLIGLALFARFILIFGLPTLSDDVYRFIWDGRLWLAGVNPFDHLPSYYIDKGVAIEGINRELLAQLNSPEYFTIYPPIAQAIFAFAVWLLPNSILGATMVMKFILFLFDFGSIFLIIKLLNRFKLPIKNSLLYALNPLIIIEICGNLHFEGVMIFFLLLSIYCILATANANTKWIVFAGIAFACSIAAKLLTIIFLPFYIKRLGWKNSVLFFGVIGLACVILFFPLINGVFLENFGESLNLYFQKFEFNASIYYCLRWIGFQIIGWNLIAIIGPCLAICTFLIIVSKAYYEKNPTWRLLPMQMLFAITIYLAFTTTVHPWYLALPILLMVFTNFRFPMVWSLLIVGTYINYSYQPYFENLFVVGLEYLITISFLFYEIFFTNKSSKSSIFAPISPQK